jgi:protein TonB
MFRRRVLGIAAVLLLHGLLLAAAWFERSTFPRADESVVAVALLNVTTPVREEEPPAPLLSRPAIPLPAVLVDVPAIQPPVAVQRAAESPIAPSELPASAQATTEILGAELAVQCIERAPPRYPPQAKRQREQGEVRLRVELDESGRVDRVAIVSSSGSARLDEAALTAVESWRCRPAQRDGQPVRAVALQSLAFVLERR